MKILFFWNFSQDGKYPGCFTDVVGGDGVDVLACLLTDDGGQGYKSSIEWMDCGISKVIEVIGGELDGFSWDRDSWGVNLRADKAVIYSLLDDGCSVVMKMDDFYDALLKWREFLHEDGKDSFAMQKQS